MVEERKLNIQEKSRVGGDESPTYVVSDDATTDIFSSFQMHFN
jgi:hypothetical protein